MSKEVFHQMLSGEIEQDETIAGMVQNLYELDKIINEVEASEKVYRAAEEDLREKRRRARKAQEEIMKLMEVYKSTRYDRYYYNWGERDQ